MSIIIPANTLATGGFEVANSARFNNPSSDYLNKSFGNGNRKTFTISAWVKRSNIAGVDPIFSRYTADSDAGFLGLYINSNAKLNFTGWNTVYITTNRLFRDLSAWYHIVLAVDTTQSTNTNRWKLYINGVQETSFATAAYPNQNTDLAINQNVAHMVGRYSGNYLAGYMSEVVFIDGLALAPDQFGEFDEDSNIWKPIKVSGLTFGNNGFYLDFEDSSALGNDAAGSNNWTANNLTAIDQSTDTCTNNFATLNPLNYSSSSKTYAFGNTAITASASGSWNATLSNFAVSSGKWYTEYKITAVGSFSAIGVGYQPFNTNASAYLGSTFLVGEDTGSFGWRNNGARPQGGSNLSSWGTNDILMIAIDMDNQKLYFGKNGTWETSGNPESGATGTGSIGNLTAGEDYLFVICPRGGGTSVNFGSPSFAISSGNADGDGYGNFEYAVPSGYFSLNTKNLAEYG